MPAKVIDLASRRKAVPVVVPDASAAVLAHLVAAEQAARGTGAEELLRQCEWRVKLALLPKHEWLTQREAAELLGCSAHVLNSRRVPVERTGRRVRYSRAALLALNWI